MQRISSQGMNCQCFKNNNKKTKADTNKLFADIKLFTHAFSYTHVCKGELYSNSKVKKKKDSYANTAVKTKIGKTVAYCRAL